MAPRTTLPQAEIYVARSTGVQYIDGEKFRYFAGRTRVRVGHPLLRKIPEKFEPLRIDYEVEQMTAAPGEKRK